MSSRGEECEGPGTENAKETGVRKHTAVLFRTLVVALVAFGVVAAVALAANLSGDGTIVGTNGNDNINAGNGNDTIWGLGGSDSINAGNGSDVIDGGGSCPPGVTSGVYPSGLPGGAYCEHGPVKPCGSDNINAGNGNDTIWGNCGVNNINVGSGTDTVYAYGGPNSINVGNGSDTVYLYDTSGASALSTGSGKDVVYAQNGVVDTINCGSKNTTVYADKNDKTSNCTVLYTSPSRDLKKKQASHKQRRDKRIGKKKRSSRTHRRSSHRA
jgi:Ca2+-binding RTX toxin-like protein